MATEFMENKTFWVGKKGTKKRQKANIPHLQKLHNVWDESLNKFSHASNASSALITGPLSHQILLRASTKSSADGIGLQEGGVHGNSNDSPVGAEDGLTEGWVLSSGTEGGNQNLGLMGKALFSLQMCTKLG